MERLNWDKAEFYGTDKEQLMTICENIHEMLEHNNITESSWTARDVRQEAADIRKKSQNVEV